MSGFDISMYRDMFIEEAGELFESADNVLLVAEKNGSLTDDEMGQLFRDVHTLKGSGASVELTYFAEFTHDVENLMDKLRNHKIEFVPEMAGTLMDGLDVMKEILQMENDGQMDRETFEQMSTELLKTIRAYINGDVVPSLSVATSTNSENLVDEVVVSSVSKNLPSGQAKSTSYGFFGEDALEDINENDDFGFFDSALEITPDSIMESNLPKEDMAKEEPKIVSQEVSKPVVPQVAAVAKKIESNDDTENGKKAATTNNIRVNLDKIDNLMNNVGDLVITNAMLTQFASTIAESKTRGSVLERLELLERHIREMQDSIMSIRMVPMESIYSKFPKVVRDISKKLNKKVEFKHDGDSVEIDKAMIEGLTDPLMHIIRNSLDHGLETPDVRRASGKNETGIISISAEQANGQMIITIKDDGKGINSELVAQKALTNGTIDENQYKQMSSNDKAMLIFGAGLSTAEEITEISGRGVGMDVVKTNIQKLGGIIKLDTEIGQGTTIIIMLPLTLAILDGLDIAVGKMKYILPLSSIVESLQPTNEMIKKIGDGTQDLLMLRQEFIPIVRLYKLFNITPKYETLEDGMLIVVKSGNQKIAVFIDEFLHQHQVVVKPLDKNFKPVMGIGAATVRGDGSIGLILDIVGLIQVQKDFDHGHIKTESTHKKVS
ncbi:MAG: chemotaxis protein CheA [Arcobacteraceae bacterium]|jgi:two-component system chemotaxis sensor kinase CheA|nr:chemotaxis protein CheA [Arcobacteraceae bacterium]